MADLDMVRRTLDTFIVPGQVVEVRCLSAQGRAAVCLVSSDFEALARFAAQCDQAGASGCYFTPNPLRAELLGGTASAKKADVLERHALLIDVDSYRPTGTNASEPERQEARSVLTASRNLLRHAGLVPGVLGDSGNGCHLAYWVLMPHDDASQDLQRDLLTALNSKFGAKLTEREAAAIKARQFLDVPRAGVDTSCHDAPRIWKLYGTTARKGPHSPERPHRLSTLIEGTPWDRAVAERNTPLLPKALRLALETFEDLDRFGAGCRADGQQQTYAQAYCRKGLAEEAAKVAAAVPGTRNQQLNLSGFAVGQLVGTGHLGYDEALNRLYMAALDAGCDNPRKDKKTLNSGLKAGALQPRVIPLVIPQPPPVPVTPTAAPGKSAGVRTYHIDELLRMQIPEPSWAVPGLLSEGLTILAGKPKLGKSWMALNLALTVAGGGLALGMARAEQGAVLYLALEDRLRRVQDRARKLLFGLDCPACDLLEVAVEWPRQDKQGLYYLGEWLARVINPRLVIIDVWQKFRPLFFGRGSQYEQDYEAGSQLKSLLDKYHCSSLALHHCKKGSADDTLEEVSGTLGLAGSADGVLVLSRSRGQNEGKLFITGRDVEETELALKFDPATFCWTSLGSAKAHGAGKVRAAVLEAFRRSPGVRLWPSEMADLLEMDQAVVKTTMWRMGQNGELLQIGGKYTWPGPNPVQGDVTVLPVDATSNGSCT